MLSILGPGLGADGTITSLVAVTVLFIAAMKIRLVGLDFMELRHAPTFMRLGFEGYCAAVFLLLASLYFLA